MQSCRKWWIVHPRNHYRHLHATGYGYIEIGEMYDRQLMEIPIHKVLKFKEKPDQKLAEEFVKSGTHLWNSGMFIWKTSQILAEMKELMPELYGSLGRDP